MEPSLNVLGETEHVQSQLRDGFRDHLLVEHAHNRILAVNAGHDGHTEVDRFVPDLQAETAVLGHAPLGDVQVAHDLDPRNDGQLELLVDRIHGLDQDAVQAEFDADEVVLGFDVNVAGSFLDRREDDGVNQLDDGAVLVGQLFDRDDVFAFLIGSVHDPGDKSFRGFLQDLLGGFSLSQGLLNGSF